MLHSTKITQQSQHVSASISLFLQIITEYNQHFEITKILHLRQPPFTTTSALCERYATNEPMKSLYYAFNGNNTPMKLLH